MNKNPVGLNSNAFIFHYRKEALQYTSSGQKTANVSSNFKKQTNEAVLCKNRATKSSANQTTLFDAS